MQRDNPLCQVQLLIGKIVCGISYLNIMTKQVINGKLIFSY